MFESIEGLLVQKTATKAVIQAGGIGYRISIGINTYSHLPHSAEKTLLFLSQVVREDSLTLFGFITQEERDLFELLITISGIGPKSGLAITSHIEMDLFYRAIQNSDVKLLSKVPGVGKKTAERLIMEMRDKLQSSSKNKAPTLSLESGLMGDAINALLNLGYNPMQAQKAVKQVMKEDQNQTDLGKIITASLQKI